MPSHSVKLLASALAVCGAPLSAMAATTTLFDDDFAAEVAGKPATGFAQNNVSTLTQWDVTDGLVDLFTHGGFGLPCSSAGCLDLEGSLSNAVRMESKTTFSFLAGADYALTLAISGKNGNGDESLQFGVVGANFGTVSMPSGDNAARVVSLSFNVGAPFTGKLFIDHAGNDNYGILLDRVTLTQTTPSGVVPLPATLPLALGGLAALGFAGARRRA